METELSHYQLKEQERGLTRAEREKLSAKLALMALFAQNEKDPFVKDNPNIIPGEE